MKKRTMKRGVAIIILAAAAVVVALRIKRQN